MKRSVKQIATVQMGYSFRTRLEYVKEGSVLVVQMKDLLSNNIVSCDNLMRIEMESVKEHHIVKKGDIIFRSRGLVTKSAIILNKMSKAVVAAPLFRIRVVDKYVIPEYLNWYINQPKSQSFLASRAKGTSVKMISKNSIEDVEVFIPSLKKQREIVGLAELFEREKTLLKTLAQKKEAYYSQILIKIAEGDS